VTQYFSTTVATAGIAMGVFCGAAEEKLLPTNHAARPQILQRAYAVRVESAGMGSFMVGIKLHRAPTWNKQKAEVFNPPTERINPVALKVRFPAQVTIRVTFLFRIVPRVDFTRVAPCQRSPSL
jgi:hypothetical protein